MLGPIGVVLAFVLCASFTRLGSQTNNKTAHGASSWKGVRVDVRRELRDGSTGPVPTQFLRIHYYILLSRIANTTKPWPLQILTTSNHIQAAAHTLRGIPRATSGLVWASPLSSGQDPLDVLDVRGNTLDVLYISCARLSVSGALPPRWDVLEEFCNNYDVEQARAAPDREESSSSAGKSNSKATYEARVIKVGGMNHTNTG
ncbi:hypothetical protein BDQ17DRAFT_1323596 [Cyathus striatus]|nr:hypothetical protein BDQ17DRAFT_1323596 [Cyathus striatus]